MFRLEGRLPTRPPLASASRSRLSRLPVEFTLGLCLALSLLAFAARAPAPLVALTGVDILLLFAYRIPWKVWRQGLKFFLVQTILIGGLYILRYGASEGWWPGMWISWQLVLAFLPGLAFLHATPRAHLVRTLSRVLPDRIAFVLAMSAQFFPMLLREYGEIYESQVLRGARILRRDLLWPGNWPDLVHCLVVPAVVRGMTLASDIALAARARGFGRNERRTSWPGNHEGGGQ